MFECTDGTLTLKQLALVYYALERRDCENSQPVCASLALANFVFLWLHFQYLHFQYLHYHMPAYPGISSEAFRHPLDREAEDTLRGVPGFDLVARKFVEFLQERPQSVYLMGHGIRVGPRQYATLYHLFQECVQDLDISPEPALFVSRNALGDSFALGKENPCVVLSAGILNFLNEAELRVVLAHELGHIKCGHALLTQTAIWAMGAASLLGDLTLGLGNLISSGLIYSFYEWRRQAELSADRAALLIVGDLTLVMKTLMKLAGGGNPFDGECNLEELIQQAENSRTLDKDDFSEVYKFLLYNGAKGTMLSHPFPVDRLLHLRDWEQSAEYRQIRAGSYCHRTERSVGVVVAEEVIATATALRQQIEVLQQEINRLKDRDS